MRNIGKWLFGLMFSVGGIMTANAQTDTSSLKPKEDDAIVCVEVSPDMFDCYVMDENKTSGKRGNPNRKDDTYHNDNNKGTGKEGDVNWNQSEQMTPNPQPDRENLKEEIPGTGNGNGTTTSPGTREILNTEEANPEIQAQK